MCEREFLSCHSEHRSLCSKVMLSEFHTLEEAMPHHWTSPGPKGGCAQLTFRAYERRTRMRLWASCKPKWILSRVCCGVIGQRQLNTLVSKVCRPGRRSSSRSCSRDRVLLLGLRGVAPVGVPLTRLTERSDPSNRRNRARL